MVIYFRLPVWVLLLFLGDCVSVMLGRGGCMHGWVVEADSLGLDVAL